ncbi:MAG TPA: alkaline phosphatase family protein, partial [Burkholderiales bacterium]
MLPRSLLALVLLLLSVPLFAAAPPAPGEPRFRKVMVLIFENTDYEEAIKRPFFSSLARKGALLSDYHAIGHPSQPNYIALIAGDTLGLNNNKPAKLDDRHLGDLLGDAGKTWGVYAEGYPGGCFLGETSGRYARKHVPFLSFRNVQENPALCSRVKNAAALDSDLAAGALPDFSLYVPNLDDDGHDTGVQYADAWMARAFGPRLANPDFMKDLLLVVTFDEGSDAGNNRVLTLFIGDSVTPGAV